MKKSIVVVLLSIGFCISIYAQTKVISHKSHSGSKATFKTALNTSIFDMSASNFGAAPVEFIRRAKLDSVIHLTDTSAIMVTSEVCWSENRGRRDSDVSIWKAGKDTLDYHPLFTKKHSLDSIKNVLELQYNFQNPVDSVVFIGYDNEKPTPKPIVSQPQEQSSTQSQEQKHPQEQLSKKEQRKKRKAERKKRKEIKKKDFVENTMEQPQVILTAQYTEPTKIEAGYNKGFIILGMVLISVFIGFVFHKK